MKSSHNSLNSISGALRQIQPLLPKITQASSLKELGEGVFTLLKSDFDFESTGFYFINPETRKLELLLAQGLTDEEAKEAESTAMDRHPGWVIKNKKTYLNNGSSEDPLDFQKRLKLTSRLYCPVIFKGECIGTIGVASSQKNIFTEDHVAFIEFLCQISAVAYENILHMIELQKSEERMNHAIDSLKFGIWDWDMVNGNLYWDDYMYTLYEAKKDDFSGYFDAFQKTLHPEDEDKLNQDLKETFANRRDFKTEFRIITPSGKVKLIAATSKCFYDDSGKILRLVGANWDITETKEKELQLLQASKMSSLGEMSSGIAHEINNPLAIILGKSFQLKKVLAGMNVESEMVDKLINDIDRTVDRISKIVKGLRNFSRDGVRDPFEYRTIRSLVEDTLSFCGSRFMNHGIQVELELKNGDSTIQCRPTQISQVLLNLLNNAYDAIEDSSEKWVKIESHDMNGGVEISITDSGSGIPKNIQNKIMQPFFTTKEVGKGTGLGLSISHGIIRSHHGNFSIDPNCPNTRFVLQLPLVQKA